MPKYKVGDRLKAPFSSIPTVVTAVGRGAYLVLNVGDDDDQETYSSFDYLDTAYKLVPREPAEGEVWKLTGGWLYVVDEVTERFVTFHWDTGVFVDHFYSRTREDFAKEFEFDH